MSVLRTATCPTCHAVLDGDGSGACAQCGATNEWSGVERTPLILPGSPAFSEEVPSTGVSPTKIAAGALAVCSVVLGVLFLRSDDVRSTEPRDVIVATADQPAEAVSSGDAVISTPVESGAEGEALVADSAGARNLADAIPTTMAAAAPSSAAEPPAAAIVAPIPALRMAPLPSGTLKPGDQIRLRGIVIDQRTEREITGSIRFSSSDQTIALIDRWSGVITALKPGRVRIIADGAEAGRAAVEITVRPPLTSAVADATPVERIPTPSAIVAPARPAVATVAPIVPERVTAAVPEPARGNRASELPDADDVRSASERLVADVRSGTQRNAELREFFADGANHRVSLLGSPTPVGETATSIRTRFDIRLTKFDAAGRPMTRVSTVSMEVAKRDAVVSASAVAFSALRRP